MRGKKEGSGHHGSLVCKTLSSKRASLFWFMTFAACCPVSLNFPATLHLILSIRTILKITWQHRDHILPKKNLCPWNIILLSSWNVYPSALIRHYFPLLSRKKGQSNYKQFTSYFPVSWAPDQLKMIDVSNFFNTAAMQNTQCLSLSCFPPSPVLIVPKYLKPAVWVNWEWEKLISHDRESCINEYSQTEYPDQTGKHKILFFSFSLLV